MKKKIILLSLCMLMFLTGCGGSYNSSPDAVAEEMAKRLSEGDYKKISELIYFEENGFIDESSFRNYLSENDLLIEGNSKYKFISSTTESNGENSVVKISIDDNRILQVNTVKKDNKWYVDLGTYVYDEDLIIKVPAGSKVYLNNVELDYKKYAKTEPRETFWSVGSTKYEYTYSVDTYTIPTLLEGKYDLKVEQNNITTVNEEIHSDKSDYIYYMDDENRIFNSGSESYIVNARADKDTKDEIKTFVSTFYNELVAKVEKKEEFSTINKYFDTTESDSMTKYESSYKKMVEDLVDNSYTTWKTYNSDLKVKLDYEDITSDVYYVAENRYFVVAKRIFEYKATTKYSSNYYKNKEDKVETETESMFVVLDVEKKNDSYIINGGINVIPSL